MATITVVVGDQPYGKERFYTTMRFVLTAVHEGHTVNLFLIEDSVLAPKKGQKPIEMPIMGEKMPNCEELLKSAIKEGVKVKLCSVCASERSVTKHELIEGVELGTMKDLVNWTLQSDKVITF